MKTVLRRLNDAKLVTRHGVKHCVKDVYIRVTHWSLTMSGSTEEVRWHTCRLGLYLVTRIEYVSHLAIKLGIK